MAINPPFSLIGEMSRMAVRPSAASALAQGVGNLSKDLSNFYIQKKEKEIDAVTTFLKNFDVRPGDPAAPTNGPKVKDILGPMLGGNIPKMVPPNLLEMNATPKFDIQAMSRVFPALANLQPPGKETPVTDFIQPGMAGAVGIQGGATVQPNKNTPGGSRGSGTNPWGGISSRARAKVGQMIQQASANPQSANVKNFPILDPNYSQKVFMDEVRKEAKLVGIKDEEIESKVGELQQEFDKQYGDFTKARQQGLQLLEKVKDDPKKRQKYKETIRQRLQQQFPTMVSAILYDEELK